jgi:hypothetical protein
MAGKPAPPEADADDVPTDGLRVLVVARVVMSALA